MSLRNQPVIAAQRAELDRIVGRFLGPGRPYAILDFPDHSNVGDSAIYVGEVRLLEALTGRRASYVCTHRSYDPAALASACPDGPVFIHGGGNFGDFWPEHQRFRERVLETLRERTVVQLPQSIKFRDDVGIARCRAAFAGHKDAHILVRDAESLAFVRQHFDCPVDLSPDCAFAIGPLDRRGQPEVETLLLLREDHERVSHDRSPLDGLQSHRVDDWLDEPARGRAQRAFGKLEAVLAGRLTRAGRDEMKYEKLATQRVERGLRLLSQGRAVITDRLHAHILCTLLDIPHVALDNVYGKIANYVGAWTSAYPAVRLAGDLAEALAKLEALRAELGEVGRPTLATATA